MQQAVKSILASALYMTLLCSTAHAKDAFGPGEYDTFDNSTQVADSELDKMRGGFVMANGLLIDFAINTLSVIDDIPQTNLSISTQNLGAIDPNDLKQVIQVGAGSNPDLGALANNPGLLNIIQNREDGVKIQNFSQVDIDVSNLQAFENQTLVPISDFQTVMSLR